MSEKKDNKIIDKILSDFNIGNFEDNLGCVDIDTIKNYEKLIGSPLPSDYKYYLLKFGKYSNYLEKEALFQSKEKNPWSDERGLNSFDLILGFEKDNNLNIIYRRYIEQIPREVIPIATSEGGNLICLGIHSDYINKIYFGDHESIESNCLYLINESFEKFLISLSVSEDEIVEDINSKIESSWFDPSLFD